MKTGQKIQKIREIKGIKQASLAKMINITQQRLSQIEQAEEVEDSLLIGISKALNTTPDAILNFKEDYAINNFNSFGSNGQAINYQIVMTDKLIETYERLLNEKDARIQYLEKQILK